MWSESTSEQSQERSSWSGQSYLYIIMCTTYVPVVTVSGEKVGYAKKMAQGYLKSVGSGDYTPKYSAYTRENMVNTGEGQPHWTLKDDQGQDEFDFWQTEHTHSFSKQINSILLLYLE